MAGCFGLALYSTVGQKTKRQDSETKTQLSETLATIDSFYYDNGFLPLNESEINNFPKDKMVYKNLGADIYYICSDFKTESNGSKDFVDSLTAEEKQILNYEIDQLKDEKIALQGRQELPNYLAIGYSSDLYSAGHQKGFNCFVRLTNENAYSGSSSQADGYGDPNNTEDACLNFSSEGLFIAIGAIKSVNTANKQIRIESIELYNEQGDVQKIAEEVYSYDSNTLFCSGTGPQITPEQLSAGRAVDFYIASPNDKNLTSLVQY